MVSLLESILHLMPTDFVTTIVILSIFIIFAVSVVFHLKNIHQNFTVYTPTLLTSVGILGTFIGISIGLVNFDTQNIDGSIQELLGGMKTAFFTSLAGMSFSIVFKIFQHFAQQNSGSASEEFNASKMMEILSKQEKNLGHLITALGGDADSSILSQIKLLRGDINDHNKIQKDEFNVFSNQLWLKLQDFADILSKSATETIIDALRQVIVDFNKNLTEQFGDNFKELNNAVINLVTWQENYKEQIERMVKQYELSVTAITATELSIAKIREETQAIPLAMNEINDIITGLSSVIKVNQNQIQELERHLVAFMEMKDKAVEAVPIIEEQVAQTIRAISASVESASNHYNSLVKDTTILQERATESLENLQKALEIKLNETFSVISEKMHNIFSNIDAGLQAQVKKTGEAVGEQISLLDENLRNEIHRAMQELGTALGQISIRLVDEYERFAALINNNDSSVRS